MNRRILRRSAAAGCLLAAAGAFLAGRSGASAPEPPPPDTPRPLAWLRDASGSVLVGGTSGGRAASSRTPMAAHDELATENGARAVLELRRAGTLVVGSRAALQVLAEDWDGPRLRPTRVRFLRGTLRADASADTDALTIDLGDRVVEIAPGGSAFLAWAEDALAISMLKAGGVVRTRDGSESIVAAGQGLRVTRAGGLARPASLPGPIDRPGRVRERLWAPGGKAQPTFRFPGERGSVHVVVARDEGLTEVVADATAPGESVRIAEGIEPGNYYWSAARVDTVSKLTGPFTAPRPLTVLRGEGPPAADDAPDEPIVITGASTRVFFSGSQPPIVALDWAGITDESRGYSATVSRDAKHRTPYLEESSEESRLVLGRMPEGTWHWRVRGADGRTQAGRFVVKKASGDAARTRRTSQVREEFDRATVFFQREAPAVEFHWKPDPRASTYRLLVSRDRTFATTLLSRPAPAPPLTVEPGALPEGEVFWRVERLRADGTVYYPGKTQALAVRFDLENPNLELAQPAEGARVAGDTVQVTGLAPRDTALWVNGIAVAPDRRGRFSVEAHLGPGEPTVVVKTARDGKDFAYFVRTLSR